MPESTRVLIIGEVENERLNATTKEAIAAGHHLAQKINVPVCVGLVGNDLQIAAQEAITSGADNVYTIENPLLKQMPVDLYLTALEEICRKLSPSILLLGRTTLGRDIGPILAFRLKAGFAQDCIKLNLNLETGSLLADRPVYGGNAIATVAFNTTLQIASIRPKVYAPLEANSDRKGEVINIKFPLENSEPKVRVLKQVKEEHSGTDLGNASVVVAGGRGIGGPEPFLNELQELADSLAGNVGASRAAVDSGWVPSNYQIGLTGITIAPDLYIAVGLSGASQHMAGCSGAKNIVAVNKDIEANIFKEASFGVVGDWKRILPAFNQSVKELQKD